MPPNRILLDIECQRDLFIPGGALFRRGATGTARKVYRLFAWARKNHVPVLSTALRLRSGQLGPLGDVPHCIEDTPGERKLAATVLRSRIDLGLRGTTDLPDHIFDRYQQVIVEKRRTDIFAHPRLERLISELPPVTFVLCGAGAAHGILQAAIGLRARGFSVMLASDATLGIGEADAEMARNRMHAKSVVFTPVERIVAPAKPTRRRAFRDCQPAGRQAFRPR